MAGNFYSVECPDCENEQIVFGKAATDGGVRRVRARRSRDPTGGKAVFEGEVLDTVERRNAPDELVGIQL